MITNGRPPGFLAGIVLLVMAVLIPAITSSADCLRDLHGEVYCGAGQCLADREGTIWCSRYYDGGAERTSDGHVLCGKGRCAKRSDGRVFCSSEVGGAVLIDSSGRVRCYGQCEPATAEMCVKGPAPAAQAIKRKGVQKIIKKNQGLLLSLSWPVHMSQASPVPIGAVLAVSFTTQILQLCKPDPLSCSRSLMGHHNGSPRCRPMFSENGRLDQP